MIGMIPNNLQGIWNEDMDPAWEGKYTANINLEMNFNHGARTAPRGLGDVTGIDQTRVARAT